MKNIYLFKVSCFTQSLHILSLFQSLLIHLFNLRLEVQLRNPPLRIHSLIHSLPQYALSITTQLLSL